MTLLDLTIVNIAIPSMIDELDASLDEVLWVVNAYVLVLAVLLITAGRLGDLRGQRNLFVAGVAVFTVASLACGLAPNPSQLIASGRCRARRRAADAADHGDHHRHFPAERRGTALGIWGAVAGLATVAGPTLGGLLVTAVELALDLLRQHPDRRHGPRRWRSLSSRTSGSSGGTGWTCRASGSRPRACSASRSR